MRLNGLKVKHLLTFPNLQGKVVTPASNFCLFSLEVEEILENAAEGDPQFEVPDLDIILFALSGQGGTDEMQEKKPSSSM